MLINLASVQPREQMDWLGYLIGGLLLGGFVLVVFVLHVWLPRQPLGRKSINSRERPAV